MSETGFVQALPFDPTSFVGRETELAEIRTALGESRLVTLVGPGGVGKTRLAIRAVQELSTECADGVAFVDLSAVSTDGGVESALASALGVQAAPGVTALTAVAHHLRGREVLVILDNCEQVAAACAIACDRLADGSSAFLATSRVPLRARAETIVAVEPLALPSDGLDRVADSEAVRLFVDRARRVRRPFTLDATNAAAVVEVCRLLDGLPLAIELAAARVNAFGPERLAVELRERRELLRQDAPARPDRHRSLAACIEWSFGLLADRDRTLLERLSVFAGGFDVDAARSVCADDVVTSREIPDGLGRLVDASLVAVDHRDAGRFRLLHTIRTYALGIVVDPDRWRLRHLVWSESAGARIAALHGSDDAAAHAAFLHDRENVFGAVSWAAEHGHCANGMRVLGSLWRVCSDYGLQVQVIDLATRLLDDAPEDVDPAVRLRALLAATTAGNGAGDVSVAIGRGTEAASLADAVGDRGAKGWALTERGFARVAIHDPDAREDLIAGAAIGAEIGDDALEADALVGLGMNTALTGSVVDAVAQLERAVVLAGSRAWLLPAAWGFLGAARLLRGRLADAIVAFDTSLEVGQRRPIGHHFFFTPFATAMRAITRSYMGQPDASVADLESLRLSDRDEPHLVVRSVIDVGLAIAHQAAGSTSNAVAAYERSLETALDPFWATWAHHGLAELAIERDDLLAARIHIDAVRDQTKRSRHTFHLARLDLALALLARAEGNALEATARSSVALLAAIEHGNRLVVPPALELLAELAAQRGDVEIAVRLLGGADGERTRMGNVRTAAVARQLDAHIETGGALEALRRDVAARPLDDVLTVALAGRGPRRRPSVGWESLTPAERNVVRLVQEGLSNPEIGERLFISRRTVERHLSNVFTKTGIASRAQLAAEASRLDI